MGKNLLRTIFFILIILISLIIFGFSAQDGETSGGISKAVITKIADIIKVKENIRNEFIIEGEKIIRKLAHFAIYTALGIFSMSFMKTFKLSSKKQALITLTWGFLYACTDEIHQLFSNGRNASFLDVLLDTFGVAFGILLVIIIIFIINKVKNNIEKKKLVV